MNAMDAHPVGARPARKAVLRESLDTTAYLLGLSEVRADRAPGLLTIRLGPPAEPGLTLIDRRGQTPLVQRLDAADDLTARLAAIRAGQAGVRAKILVDPARCFMRTLTLPSAALPRMRAVLAQELEAATPFRAAGVHSDWYVEGEDAAARSLRVRHVVVKRAVLDPLLAALADAGIAAGPVTVGPDEARTMPVDLLTGGHRTLQGLAGGARKGDLALMAGAALMLLAAFWGLRAHQDATLAALDDAFAQARRAAGPALPAPVQAGAAAIVSGRGPPLAKTWDALAAALPDSASAAGLRLDADGARLTVLTADEPAALAALGSVPGFGAPFLQETAAGPDGARRLVLLLPRTDRGDRP
ncbi:general secretion pathway protein L [Methylorubrum rhodinum]|uniref:General secretion pathway protein L n=1 Tax=Methylorubrum rhodinum TaxID=29428 RepID=A0A840ZFY1_9HYPH|nr:hypothetical protein [Methylorubrum rhodinum]MBB5756088.1 general secretion pathway protein L [Methylorubrum rhodinum]